VFAPLTALPDAEQVGALIVAVDASRLYVHFPGRDRRLDRWVDFAKTAPYVDPAVTAAKDAAQFKAKTAAAAPAAVPPAMPNKRPSRLRATAAVAAAAAAAGASDDGDDNANGQQAGPCADLAGHPPQKPRKSAPRVRKVTRSRRRAQEEFNPVSERETGNDVIARLEQAREEHTKVRNVGSIVFGSYDVEAWYFSPYPVGNGSSAGAVIDVLYICPFCLKYMLSAEVYDDHCARCDWTSPPGACIYEDPAHGVTVHEVDGFVNVPYSQSLCLLGKLFLDHKTLYFDVAPFFFYVVCLDGELAGFFSKEKPLVASEFNLACIVTLPQHQRKGLGRFLIALSYELTKREGKTGSPERPLSDLGQLSYRSYWMHAVMSLVRAKRSAVGVSAKDIATATGIRVSDIVATLKSLGILTIWKTETYVDTNPKALDQAQRRISNPSLPLISANLNWKPMKKPDPVGGTPVTAPPSSPFPTQAAPPTRPRRKPRRQSTGGTPASSPTLSGPRGAVTPAASPALQLQNYRDGPSTSFDPDAGIQNAGAFSEDEVNAMKAFIAEHSAERVHAPLNSENGLSSVDVHRLAESLHMTMERCRKKLKRISSSALADPDALVIRPSKDSLPSPRASSATNGTRRSRVMRERLDAKEYAHTSKSQSVLPECVVQAPVSASVASAVPNGRANGATAVARTPDSLTDAVDGTPAASPEAQRKSSVATDVKVMPALLLDVEAENVQSNHDAMVVCENAAKSIEIDHPANKDGGDNGDTMVLDVDAPTAPSS
jgi:histone acetyltransferase MYST1